VVYLVGSRFISFISDSIFKDVYFLFYSINLFHYSVNIIGDLRITQNNNISDDVIN
jgi:hypothetical protein